MLTTALLFLKSYWKPIGIGLLALAAVWFFRYEMTRQWEKGVQAGKEQGAKETEQRMLRQFADREEAIAEGEAALDKRTEELTQVTATINGARQNLDRQLVELQTAAESLKQNAQLKADAVPDDKVWQQIREQLLKNE